MENNQANNSNFLLKAKKIWAKIEIPVAVLVLIATLSISIFAIINFNTNAITTQQLTKLYTKKLVNVELFGLLINLVRNGIIWISINLLSKNIIFAAIILIVVPRILSLPFTNKTMRATAMQGILKLEHMKLKKFYAKADEDPEVKSMYTQDSMRLPKRFGIITTEHMSAQMFSLIPVLLVSFAVSTLINDLRIHVKDLTSGGIPMAKPFILFAIVMVVLMIIQTILPLKNAHGPAADQQKQIAFVMPMILFFVFVNQPAILPMVWSVSYLISVIQMLYYYRIKRFDRQEILNRP